MMVEARVRVGEQAVSAQTMMDAVTGISEWLKRNEDDPAIAAEQKALMYGAMCGLAWVCNIDDPEFEESKQNLALFAQRGLLINRAALVGVGDGGDDRKSVDGDGAGASGGGVAGDVCR